MTDPTTYPEQPATVELRETHGAWVALAGERAYKVKKPVRYEFGLDYSTPERRRACCVEEVVLNRRLAPDVYRGVRGLAPTDAGGLELVDGDDPRAIEWAVEMRRYDESATLEARLAAGRASHEGLTRTAERLADFHAGAAIVGDHEGRTRLAEMVEETLRSLGQHVTGGGAGRRLPPLERFTRAALRGLDDELRRREDEGLVRDGHGDLRAEHVLLEHGVEVVDCLEFDAGLRALDVAFDIGFLVMDVARHDDEAARHLAHAYALAGGPAPPPALLWFAAAVRALVRAKVALLRAAQQASAEPAASAAAERAGDDLLALAQRLAWAVRLPPVLVICGLSGSGKSTLAAALGAAAGRPVIASDRVRKQLLGLEPGARADEQAYDDAVDRAVYAELGRRAATHAGHAGAIVDATFRRSADRAAFHGAAPAAAEALFIDCHAPDAVLLERVRERERRDDDVSDAGLAVAADQIADRAERPRANLTLDATRPPDEMLAQLASALDARIGAG